MKILFSLMFLLGSLRLYSYPVDIHIHTSDGCDIYISGDVDFTNGIRNFTGTITLSGNSPHCPTGTFHLDHHPFRTSSEDNDAIFMNCFECVDICNASKISFTSRNANHQTVLSFLNSQSHAILSDFKAKTCN